MFGRGRRGVNILQAPQGAPCHIVRNRKIFKTLLKFRYILSVFMRCPVRFPSLLSQNFFNFIHNTAHLLHSRIERLGCGHVDTDAF